MVLLITRYFTKNIKLEQIINLFMSMAIAYCYACKLGEIANRLKPTKLKTMKIHAFQKNTAFLIVGLTC